VNLVEILWMDSYREESPMTGDIISQFPQFVDRGQVGYLLEENGVAYKVCFGWLGAMPCNESVTYENTMVIPKFMVKEVIWLQRGK